MNRKFITIKTEKQFTPLNDIIADFIKDEKGDGMVNIFTSHTTCAIKIIENEILLLADINNYLDETFPMDKKYMHDRIEIRDVPINERVNGYSHMRQLFFSTAENIPVKDGKLLLGKWQTVFLIEFDPIRDREVILTYVN
ncbi:secondary thiamine-phosphate synthase enzyme YjbQ [Sporosarcina sp. 179-K 8C2 HS]|uniref:secondary thiamine-phosphate synthase enzyme YjbQ n=1 Tax=Sporosarcina sp. 179-K 8C2 HS TaxID=3142387 RepID=UPI00399FD233